MAVQNISGIKCGNGMWFSPVNFSGDASAFHVIIIMIHSDATNYFKDGDKSVRCAIVHVTTTYHTKTVQRFPRITKFIFQH